MLEFVESGVCIVGVNFCDFEDDVLDYLEEGGDLFFVSVFDLCGCILIDWGVSVLLEIFIIDGEGIVLFCFVGLLIGLDYE